MGVMFLVYLIYIESTAVSFPAFPLLSHDICFLSHPTLLTNVTNTHSDCELVWIYSKKIPSSRPWDEPVGRLFFKVLHI